MEAIVYPIVTGSDWMEPDPPIALGRDSKAAAIRALRKAGYRIMWIGGLHERHTKTAEELRCSHAGSTDVAEREREIVQGLPDEEEVAVYIITVWPKK